MRWSSCRKSRSAIASVAVVVLAVAVYAQQQEPQGRIWVGGGGNNGFGRFAAPKWARASDFNGSFVYCRGFFQSDRREPGGSGWNTDYPGADNNFSVRLAELTKVRVEFDKDREPNYVVVSLADPLLFHCGMLFMEDVGTVRFSEEEVKALRQYLLKGGFLSVDDFWGTAAWEQWVYEFSRVLPPHEYPIFDIPLSHPVMHTLYDVQEFLQVPAIQQWRRFPGVVSERGEDSPPESYRGVQDANGRLMVIMRHNTDVPDTWEREGEEPREYFDIFSPRGYATGVDTVLYAMTH